MILNTISNGEIEKNIYNTNDSYYMKSENLLLIRMTYNPFFTFAYFLV